MGKPKPAGLEAEPSVLTPRSLVLATGILLLCVAVAAIVASFAPYEAARKVVLSSVPVGYEDRFTTSLYARTIVAARAGGLLLLSLGLALLRSPDWIGLSIDTQLVQIRSALGELKTLIPRISEGRLHSGAFWVLVLWGAVLRLVFLFEPVRKDEAYSFLYYGSRPLFVGISYYTANNHILNTILMHVSAALFGISNPAIRLPVFLAGVALPLAGYLTMRLFHGKESALLTLAFLSGSSPLIEYSFNARGYTLAALFLLFAVLMLGVGALRNRRGVWPLVSLCLALAVYAVPATLYGILGVLLTLAVLACRTEYRGSIRRRDVLLVGVLAMLLTGLFYLPVFATVGLQAITSNQWVKSVPRTVWPSLFVREASSLWRYWNMDLPVQLGIAVAVGVFAALARRVWNQVPVLVLALCGIILLVFLPLQSLVPPRRTFLYLLPFWFAAAAAGWELLLGRFRRGSSITAIVAVLACFWMGGTVLYAKSLRHSGVESTGLRTARDIVLGAEPWIRQGAQFFCEQAFDSGLQLEMRREHIPYRPLPGGPILLVVYPGSTPGTLLRFGGVIPAQVRVLRQIQGFEDADVYLAERGPGLPFQPRGTVELGLFP